MIDLNNPLHHYNQLNFNLDASNSTSVGGDGFMNPQCVIIQKLKAPEKPIETKTNAFFPRDEKFALAVKLAKLDVSNGIWSDEVKQDEKPKESELKPSRTIKTPLLYGAEKRRPPVNHPQKAQPLRRAQKATSAPKVSKPVVPQRSARKNNVRFQEPSVFQRLTKDINIPYQVPPSLFEPVRDVGNSNRVNILRTKDASTSMSEQPSVIIPTKYKTPKAYGNPIAKAKLTGKKNAKPANRSGFLSFYRTPQRKANSSQFSNPAVSVPVAGDRMPPKSYSSTPKVGHSRPVTFHSPPTKLTETLDESVYCEDKEAVRPRPDLAQYLKDVESITSEPPAADTRFRGKEPTARKLTNPEMYGKIKEKDRVKSKPHSVPKIDIQSLQNLPTLESLLDKLNAMEQEEMEIRTRWKTIVYDEKETSSGVSNNNPGFLTSDEAKVVEIIPCALEHSEPHCQKKSVRFETESLPAVAASLGKFSTAGARFTANPPKIKLSLPENVIDCILDGKKTYEEYLKLSHHEPKGNFDPWKIAEDLSNELVFDILEAVCDEVGSAFDGCIDRVFESEFAQPDSSGSFQVSLDQGSETSYC